MFMHSAFAMLWFAFKVSLKYRKQYCAVGHF